MMFAPYAAKVAATAVYSSSATVLGAISFLLGVTTDALSAGAFTVAGIGGLVALLWRLVRDNRVEKEQKDRYEKMLDSQQSEIDLLHQRWNREYALVAAYRNHFGELPPKVYLEHVAPFDIQHLPPQHRQGPGGT